MDKERKRALKQKGKELMLQQSQSEWDEYMVLTPRQLHGLLDHLDERLSTAACDDTHRFTLAWADENGIDGEALGRSVLHFGGGCDCEVLANVDPETQVHGWPAYLAEFGG